MEKTVIRIAQVRVELDDAGKPLAKTAARVLHIKEDDIIDVRPVRRSVDARDKRDLHFSMTLDVSVKKIPPRMPKGAEILPVMCPEQIIVPSKTLPDRPLVVGMGPAGLFAALRLARAGMKPLVIERGRSVDERERDVENFWKNGVLDPKSNVQFGEGGAGTFSDGKLNSGIKDPRCRFVLNTFYEMGASEEILYAAKPHIGTDKLRDVVRNIRQELIRLGAEVRFETQLEAVYSSKGTLTGARISGKDMPVQALILAIGHSARDTFEMLDNSGVFMEQKPFSIGARIEHLQKMVNRSQYGAAAEHPALGAADYKLSTHLPDGRGAYTFCMCPGGLVVNASSESEELAVNGMSYYARSGKNADSALLISVGPQDYGADDPMAGVRFQRKWEHAAYIAGGSDYHAPAQLVGDFLSGKASAVGGKVIPTVLPGVKWTSLEECLPEYVIKDMRAAIVQFDRKLRGFADPEAVLTGVETRSSSPVRISRGEGLCALNLDGLYPCGEGAGYAGGILSAAVDGLRCADALIERLK